MKAQIKCSKCLPSIVCKPANHPGLFPSHCSKRTGHRYASIPNKGNQGDWWTIWVLGVTSPCMLAYLLALFIYLSMHYLRLLSLILQIYSQKPLVFIQVFDLISSLSASITSTWFCIRDATKKVSCDMSHPLEGCGPLLGRGLFGTGPREWQVHAAQLT